MFALRVCLLLFTRRHIVTSDPGHDPDRRHIVTSDPAARDSPAPTPLPRPYPAHTRERGGATRPGGAH